MSPAGLASALADLDRHPLSDSDSQRLEILVSLTEERDRQAAQHPADERAIELFVGLAILGEEKGECDRAALEARAALLAGHYDEVIHDAALRTELLHTAAVAVKLIELLDRNALTIGCEDGPSPMPPPSGDLTAVVEFGHRAGVFGDRIPAERTGLWCGECNSPLRAGTLGPTCPHCGARHEEIIGDPS